MELQPIAPASIRLFYEPQGTLRLTVADDRSYPVVKLYQAWPLSMPGRYLSFQDAKGDEITLIESAAELTAEAREVAEEELKRRYFTARVEAVVDIRTEFGVSYWRVRTDKGERDFVVQSLSESCIWLGEHHILIVDVDGNRFEIADRMALDTASRERLDCVL